MAVSFSTTYQRLGLIQNWSWTLFWFVTPFYAMFTLLYDVILTGRWTWLWLITFTAGTAIEILLVALGRRTFLPQLLRGRRAGVVALAFAGIVNMARNGLVATLSLQFGLLQTVDWVARLFGAVFMGVGLLLFFVAMLGSRVQHDYVMDKLRLLKQSLVHQKASSAALLRQENQLLLDQTQKTLIPRLDEIKALLINNHARLDSVNELRALVNEQVRPLSEELSRKSERLALEAPSAPVAKARIKLLSEKVLLAETIRPFAVALLSGTTYFAVSNLFQKIDPARIMVATLVEFIILWVIKALIPKHKYFSRSASLTLLVLFALVSTIPDVFSLLPEITSVNSALLYSVVFITPVLLMVGVANTITLDKARGEAEAQLQKDTESLSRETSLFEQQMWLAKRSWSFVVHGTVQAALTAAITRLSSADELEPYQLNMVLQDLDRAREALTKTPTIEVDLAAALSAVVSTWQGICAVIIQISPRAQRALDRDVNARMCVNEIVKEAVSNAVRHGEAKQAWIEIDRPDDEALVIQVRNDGRPVAGDLEHGVGTRMLDDLTLDWSLVNNRARGTVDFTANLPISILSA